MTILSADDTQNWFEIADSHYGIPWYYEAVCRPCVCSDALNMSYSKQCVVRVSERCFKANSAEICRHFNELITLTSVLLSCVFHFHIFFLTINLLFLELPSAILKKLLSPSSSPPIESIAGTCSGDNPFSVHCIQCALAHVAGTVRKSVHTKRIEA